MNSNEKKSILREIDTIMQGHEQNKRMLTLASECRELLETVANGGKTDRHLLKLSNHKGKMEGIKSLSTYKYFSDTCLKLKDNPKLICHKCYVDKTFDYAPQLKLSLIYNTILLKYTKLSDRQIPVINDLIFRFESFSDLQNQNHLQNLYRIAKKNPYTQFALWTKNYTLVWKEKCPKNVNIILSSLFLNQEMNFADLLINTTKNKTGCKNVKVFSVYDSEHIQNQNCLKECLKCQKCYSKKDKTKNIIELLK